jgi:predicted nucleic acid-binding protein
VRAALKPPPEWLKIVVIGISDDRDLRSLDEGEKAALSLGMRLEADLLLIDERRAAAVARQKGIPFTGTLGLLVLRRNGIYFNSPMPLKGCAAQAFTAPKASSTGFSRNMPNPWGSH